MSSRDGRSKFPGDAKKDKLLAPLDGLHVRHGRSRLRPNRPTTRYDIERESFLQAAFVVWVYPRLIPPADLTPPQNRKVARLPHHGRRIHARRGVELPPAPLVSKVQGHRQALRARARVDALLPDRNPTRMTTSTPSAPYPTAPDQGLPYVVDWSHIRFICFAALVNTLRKMGSRKADLISPSLKDDLSRVSRSNLKFVIGGVTL